MPGISDPSALGRLPHGRHGGSGYRAIVSDELVNVQVSAGVAVIRLNSPANRNALSTALVASLHRAIDAAEAAEARVIVLSHTGTVFCAGADLKERAAGPVDSTPMAAAMTRLMEHPLPVVAAITGVVRAGGIGLMASCDLVVVEQAVDFAFTEVVLGLVPAIISVPVLRRVTPSALAGPFLTGRPFDSAHAMSIGLVTHVESDAEAVWRTVEDLINAFLAAEPAALAETKRLLWRLDEIPADERMEHVRGVSEEFFTSPGGREGMASRTEKRPPSWAPTMPWTSG